MHTTPCGTTRFSFFLRNSFFRFDAFAAAAAAGAAPAAAAAASLGSLATLLRLLCELYLRAMVFFFAATAPFRGPLRVRALVCVLWPRTGRFRRWRSPR